MKNKSLIFLFPLTLMVFLVLGFNIKIGRVPALGKLLNPFEGVVQNEKTDMKSGEIDVAGNRNIKITFDERSVPHVFTESQDDMYFAQGFVTASDRLWQMDFISYVSGGRLAEIFGEDYLEYDREQRRLGIMEAARKALKFIESDKQTKRALDNYTAGVNAFIEQLDPKQYPLEYKLLDYKPEPWTNLKSVLIMKYIASMLSGYEQDAAAMRLLLELGYEDFNKLYPEYHLTQADSTKARFQFQLDTLPNQEYIDYSFVTPSKRIRTNPHNPSLGSNSWAISKDKSANGNPILCSDPHLGLTLPAIWYEIQLHSDETNARGVSIPGVVGIIIGYNDHISWGITSGAADVRDWFKLCLNEDYSRYKYDGIWKKTRKVVEEIHVKGKDTFYDTIVYTVHGPVTYDDGFSLSEEVKNHALKWELHQPSNEFLTIIGWNKAKNREDFEKASVHFMSPVQNLIYADKDGEIARYYQGKIYKKWKGQGRFILDGTTSKHFYSDFLTNELPKLVNPEKGFVCSANNDPFQFGGTNYVNGYFDHLRHLRIKELLSQNKKFTVSEMKEMQLDKTNLFAEASLPILLEMIESKKGKVASELTKWDYQYSATSKAAPLFEMWWDIIEEYVWDENAFLTEGVKLPEELILYKMIIEDPNNKFFDRVTTNKLESAKDIVKLAFAELEKRVGKADLKEWRKYEKVEITSLARVQPFGVYNLQVGGSRQCLNAQSNTFGPSWRMVVEFTPNGPKAWGVYPGGQSGNVASKHFDDFIDKWESEEFYELNLFQNYGEAKKYAKTELVIK